METETKHSDQVACCAEESFCTLKNVFETLELFSWLCVFSIPMLIWISGSSVSNDQYIIRCVMTIGSVLGVVTSIACRSYALWWADETPS